MSAPLPALPPPALAQHASAAAPAAPPASASASPPASAPAAGADEAAAKARAGRQVHLRQLGADGAAVSAADLASVAQLFREYFASVPVDWGWQAVDDELKGLPGKYGAARRGVLLLAEAVEVGKGAPAEAETAAAPAAAAEPVGVVALRELDGPLVGEVKRLFVRPAWRKQRVGVQLMRELLRLAAAHGYRTLRLDTLSFMAPAIRLYEELGFRRTSAYCFNPHAEAVFMEINL